MVCFAFFCSMTHIHISMGLHTFTDKAAPWQSLVYIVSCLQILNKLRLSYKFTTWGSARSPCPSCASERAWTGQMLQLRTPPPPPRLPPLPPPPQGHLPWRADWAFAGPCCFSAQLALLVRLDIFKCAQLIVSIVDQYSCESC